MIKNIKSRIQSLIKTRKINVFLLFLALSFGILLLTKLSKNYTNTFIFELNKINIPEEEVVINNANHKLQITIKTYGFELLKYHFTKPKLNIDFSKQIVKTDSVYIWTKSKAFATLSNQFNKNIEILNIVPDSLEFAYDVSAVKMVPITLLSDFNYSPGYNLSDQIDLKPDSIKVIGAQALLDKLTVIKTDTLSLNDIKQDISEHVDLKIPKAFSDLKFAQKKIHVSAKIEKHTEGTLSIPIEIINVPNHLTLKYFPKAVNVSYYTSLANFNTISENQFKVICDYSKIEEGQSFLVPQIVEKPTKVKHARIKEEQIEFIITK
ncbi:YbbR-like domain-containing protein [Lacinutrix iliipiscaria]|uniref:YbbR-like domain-containing protein n=1 Tax=Lacinutrix iliipiscaria TaxID=1230532 RepID=A0ABW5WPN5_9FLAO